MISKRFKAIIILVIVAISITELLIMYKNYQIVVTPDLDDSPFSPLYIFHHWISKHAVLTHYHA